MHLIVFDCQVLFYALLKIKIQLYNQILNYVLTMTIFRT